MYSDNLIQDDNYSLFNMRNNYQIAFDIVFILFIFIFPVFYFKKKYNFIPSMIGNSDDEEEWNEDGCSEDNEEYDNEDDDSYNEDYDDNIYEFFEDLSFGMIGLCYLGLEGTYNFCCNKISNLLEEIAKDNYDKNTYYTYYATSWPWVQCERERERDGERDRDSEEIIESNNLEDNEVTNKETDAEIDQMLDDIPDSTTSNTTEIKDQNITGTLSSVMEEVFRDKPIEEDLAMLKNCMNIFTNLCHDLNEQSKVNPDIQNGIELLPLPSSIKNMINNPELVNKLCDNVIQWTQENSDEDIFEDKEINDFELITN